MSRTLKRFHGTGSGGAWIDGNYFKNTTHFTPLRDDVDLLLAASLHKNLFVGGSENVGIPAEATGDVTLYDWVPWLVDNTGSQLSGFTDSPPSGSAATLVVQVRFLVRVSNAAINVTPKILYGPSMTSIPSTATISGTAACSATNSDYSGTNQIQTVTLTLPSGVNYFKAKLTVAGTAAAGYQVWGRAYADLYVSLP
jgi:hypothetical protein